MAGIQEKSAETTREPMPGLPADEIATVIGIAEEYSVDGWKLAADWSATRAWIEEVRALFAERRFAWPRTSWRWSDDGKEDGAGFPPGAAAGSSRAQPAAPGGTGGWVLHYERPELLDETLTELPAISALPVCPKPMPVGGDAA